MERARLALRDVAVLCRKLRVDTRDRAALRELARSQLEAFAFYLRSLVNSEAARLGCDDEKGKRSVKTRAVFLLCLLTLTS